ncbi:phage tail tape measure protein [Streptomyces viridosporus]|uniref:phage tail tape measure protein n=1 Tax=Streptomyces viridosporus TaxID=67581 RepID=UPI0036FEEAF7
MALTVGELNAILSIDDRAVDPALRRAEDAMRETGRRMGDDAERAGQDAGEALGEGVQTGVLARVRGALGKFRTAGRQAGDAVGDGLADGAAEGADQAVDQAGGKLDRLKMLAAGAGAAAGAVLVSGFQEALSQGQITARMGAQLGATGPEAQRYGKIAGQLFADAIVTDFQAGADAVKAIASSGLVPPGATNAQIKSIATNAADLANVMEVDVGMAAQAAGTMVKNGLARDGKEAFDLLVKGSKGLGAAGDDLLETFTEYSPVFKAAGLSGQTAMGLIRQGIQGGWGKDTDKIADAFKELNLRITSGSKTSSDALKSLGLDAQQVADDMSAGGARGEKAMGQVMDALRKVGPNSQTAKVAVQDLFGGPGEDLGASLFKLRVGEASKSMKGAKDAADDLGKGLRDNAAHNVQQFKQSLQQGLVDFLGGSVIPKLSKVVGFLQDHSGEIKAGAALITAVVVPALVLLGSKALWAGIQMARAWVMALGPIGWIGLAIGGLVILIVAYWDEVKAYTLAAWNWVVDKLRWAKDQVLAAVDYLGTIPGKVGAWFGQAKDWAVSKMTELVTWVTGLPGRIGAALSTLLGILRQRATSSFQALKDAAVQRALSLVTWVAGLPGRISKGIGSLSSLLTEKGKNVVQGLWSGISSMGGWIKDKIMGWARDVIPGPVAKALGIASPSKVTREQGRWIARGLIDGLTGSEKQIKAASGRLSDIIADGLNPGKRRSKALSTLSAGTKRLLSLARQEEKLASRLKTATKSLDDQIKARDKLAADVRKGVLDDGAITRQDSGGWPQTAETILAGLKADTAAAQTFAKNLATLRQKGVRSDLVAQIAQAGVAQGSSAAAALANANSSQVRQINAQQKALVAAADQAGATAGSAMYGAGIAAAQGLVKGLQVQQRAIERQMMTIAKGMSKSIRKALGIKSPSRVMALIGEHTAQGLVKGIEGEQAAVNKSMASLVETPAPGEMAVAGAGYGGGRQRPMQVQLVVSGTRREDHVLVEMIRRRVRVASPGRNVQAYFGGSGPSTGPGRP